MKYTCLLVDDERLALELIDQYIGNIPDLEVVGKISTPLEALRCLHQRPVDIMFLDIEMPEINGMQLLQILPAKPIIIFTTAHREYALEGYDLGVADYLLKPIKWERFKLAVDKARIQVAARRASTLRRKDVLIVPTGNKKDFIAFGDILFIKASKDYSIIFTHDKKHVIKKSLGQIEALLPDTQFIRVHKSYLLLKERIQQIEKNFIVISEYKIPIGRNYKQTLVKIWK